MTMIKWFWKAVKWWIAQRKPKSMFSVEAIVMREEKVGFTNKTKCEKISEKHEVATTNWMQTQKSSIKMTINTLV